MNQHDHLADGIILFAHGSRDPTWAKPIEAVARRIQSQHANLFVTCAYLELCSPTLKQATTSIIERVQVGTKSISFNADLKRNNAPKRIKIRIVPMFLGMGKHAREDLPLLTAELRQIHPQIDFEVQTAIGEDERVTALLAQLALDR